MSSLFARRSRGEDLSALACQARAWDHPAAPPPQRAVTDAPGGPTYAPPWRLARPPRRVRPA